MLCVQPGPEQEKLKEQLLSAVEQHTRPDEVRVLVAAQDQKELAFFSPGAINPRAASPRMIADLDQARPLPPLAEGYLLHPLSSDEEEVPIRVVNTAYRGECLQSGVLARWKAEDSVFTPQWVQVAESKGEVVAAVVTRTDWEFNAHYCAKRGYLGPVTTLPEHQGKGLGTALTAQAVNFLHEQGFEQVCLYTFERDQPALRITESLGFHIGHEWKILTKSTTR